MGAILNPLDFSDEDPVLKRNGAHRAGARSAAKECWRTESEIEP